MGTGSQRGMMEESADGCWGVCTRTGVYEILNETENIQKLNLTFCRLYHTHTIPQPQPPSHDTQTAPARGNKSVRAYAEAQRAASLSLVRTACLLGGRGSEV